MFSRVYPSIPTLTPHPPKCRQEHRPTVQLRSDYSCNKTARDTSLHTPLIHVLIDLQGWRTQNFPSATSHFQFHRIGPIIHPKLRLLVVGRQRPCDEWAARSFRSQHHHTHAHTQRFLPTSGKYCVSTAKTTKCSFLVEMIPPTVTPSETGVSIFAFPKKMETPKWKQPFPRHFGTGNKK